MANENRAKQRDGLDKCSIIISLGEHGELTATASDCDAYASKHPTGAVFDPTRKYRYLLWRTWSQTSTPVCFVMLNPSTADAFRTDPTIARCINFASEWGYGGVRIVNLFAYRSTDPSQLVRRRDPVGPLNDLFILGSIRSCRRTILAWGNHGTLRDRHLSFFSEFGTSTGLYHLGLTLKNQPKHLLYVPGQTKAIALKSDEGIVVRPRSLS